MESEWWCRTEPDSRASGSEDRHRVRYNTGISSTSAQNRGGGDFAPLSFYEMIMT